MRLIDANLAMRKIREYMEDYPNATARLAACRACLSILGDKQQVPTMTNGDKIRRVMAQGRSAHITREQVERMRGEWNYSHKTKIDGFDVVQCSKCGQEALTLALYVKNGNFCPYCGAPMTDEAVEMVMERMEALHEEN